MIHALTAGDSWHPTGCGLSRCCLVLVPCLRRLRLKGSSVPVGLINIVTQRSEHAQQRYDVREQHAAECDRADSCTESILRCCPRHSRSWAAIFDFQRNVVYPQQAINNARALIGQVQGIYNAIRGIWNIVVRSATLPNPRQLEAVILSRDPGQIGAVGRELLGCLHAAAGRNRSTPSTARLDR